MAVSPYGEVLLSLSMVVGIAEKRCFAASYHCENLMRSMGQSLTSLKVLDCITWAKAVNSVLRESQLKDP